jgi:hypothetical protein
MFYYDCWKILEASRGRVLGANYRFELPFFVCAQEALVRIAKA